MTKSTEAVPYPLKVRPYWGLNVNLTTDASTLEDIPGLTVNARESRVEGMIDAIAAAAFRLGRELPPKFPAVSVEPSVPLHAYQREGLSRLWAITNATGSAILADDMGLGKTRQAIAFAIARAGRVFVICPAFVRESWRAELSRLAQTDFAILGPVNNKRDQSEWDKAATATWVVTSYDAKMMERAYEAGFQGSAPTTFIMDEAHRLRGRGAKRTKSARQIGTLSSYRLMLTGTPMWSRPRDFYALLSCLFGNRFGNQYAFDGAYCGGGINEHGGWTNKGATKAEELKRRLSYYMVRRERADVAHELPSLTRQVIWTDPDKAASDAFERALLFKGDAGAAANALLATHESKIEAAIQLAEEAGRFLLLTHRKAIAHHMAQTLNEGGTGCVLITGDIPTPKRQALVQQARDLGHGVVATIDSIYEGVDGIQHVADIGIMHALDYVPLKMAQAEARLHRLGQTKPVQWIYLACRNSMDELVVNTVVEKMDQARAILGDHVGKELRDSISDSRGSEEDALKALYDTL